MRKKQERPVFRAAFKMEAVRRLDEQRALKIPVTAIARDLAVRPDMLRAWARQVRVDSTGRRNTRGVVLL